MANFVGDLSQQIVSASLYATSTGVSTSANASGSSVDISGDVGNILTGIQVVGNVAGTTPTMDTKIQESTDGTTWTDVTGGTFAQVTTSNVVQLSPFKPTKRYVRTTGTVSGTNPVFEATTLIYGAKINTPGAIGGFDTSAAPGN